MDSNGNAEDESGDNLVPSSSSDDLSIKIEEYLEVIATDDQRIKIIGEELSNDTGRAIFSKIIEGVATPTDLAKALNVSLPLVNWHLNRLVRVELVRIHKTERSSKNKEMNYYGANKIVLVIVPAGKTDALKQSFVRAILHKLSNNLASILSFSSASLLVYGVMQFLMNKRPAINPSSGLQLLPYTSPIPNELEVTIISLLAGIIAGASVSFIPRILRKKERKYL